MSCFSSCISFFISYFPLFSAAPEKLDLPHFDWSQTIHGDQISLQLVTDKKDTSFHAICEMYKLDETTLATELKDMILWCVYDRDGQPIGAVQINPYHSLDDLKHQVSDSHLASTLFDLGKVLELSYALTEKNRGRGLGSTIVKTWIDHARENGWSQYLFAVVSNENTPSVRILEKCAFNHIGNYIHEELNENIRVYSF